MDRPHWARTEGSWRQNIVKDRAGNAEIPRSGFSQDIHLSYSRDTRLYSTGKIPGWKVAMIRGAGGKHLDRGLAIEVLGRMTGKLNHLLSCIQVMQSMRTHTAES